MGVREPMIVRKGGRMYEKDGERYFVVDGHIHLWDASPENQKNKYGEGFISDFYEAHRSLSPPEYLWPKDKFRKYTEEDLIRDVFEEGYADRAISLPTMLPEFYVEGFNSMERLRGVAGKHPERFVLNGWFDPRLGEAGLESFEAEHEAYGFKGVKLYTAEWRGDSRGWKLTDPGAVSYLEKCRELGVKNIHVHKGPTIWPLSKDAFDVSDVDEAAAFFTDLNFIVEHVGLPRFEDFCWIADHKYNIYAGLSVLVAFSHLRPKYFARVMGELLWWLGEDRILFGSDYALWHPKWLVENLVDFEMPEDMLDDFAPVTPDAKRKMLGINAARLYGLEVPEEMRPLLEPTDLQARENPIASAEAAWPERAAR